MARVSLMLAAAVLACALLATRHAAAAAAGAGAGAAATAGAGAGAAATAGAGAGAGAAAAAGAGAGAAAPAPGGFACNPLKDKTCKLGEPKAPEDTEEEGGLGTKLPSLTSVSIPGAGKVDRDGDGDTDEDDELPSFDTHMTILGH